MIQVIQEDSINKVNNLFCVVIVTYNSDSRFSQNVHKLISNDNVGDIIISDNSTEKNSYVHEICKLNKVRLISNGKNLGIGYAQNVGIDYAKTLGYKWVLTLDHDTIVKDSFIKKLHSFLINNDCSKVAVIGTDYYDVGRKRKKFNNEAPINVATTISSGSLINIEVYEKVGKMKAYYFIDQIDNEYCYRVVKQGYEIVILPGIGMEHKLGNIEMKKICGFEFCLYNQTPIRVYYRTRNMIIFMREYKDLKLIINNIKSLLYDLVRLFFEKNKCSKYAMFFKGLFEGLFIDIKKQYCYNKVS